MVRGKSLRGLIALLVDEVAICGKAGALPSRIVSQIKAYYLEPSNNDSQAQGDQAFLDSLRDDTPPMLDRAFLEYVWEVLIRDPEISVGDRNQYQYISLVDAEATHSSTKDHQSTAEVQTGVSPTTKIPNIRGSEAAVFRPERASNKEGLENGATESISPAPAPPSSAEGFIQSGDGIPSTGPTRIETADLEPPLVASTSRHRVRLFTNADRIWQTITGHEPDSARIPNLDFVCLSIIAACGPQGIPQNDLVRISGQDKRSLPMRTDRLHKNGYIIKRPVTVVYNQSLTHTSLLTLKRFAESSEITALELTEVAKETRSGTSQKKKKKKKKKRASTENRNRVQKSTQEAGNAYSQKTFQTDEGDSLTNVQKSNTMTQWTPDRNILNQIFDVVHQSGAEGITSHSTAASMMGADYRRPIEDLLSKLTNSWQLSQPPHLRHLGIVRDSIQRGKSPVYIYYTFQNYKKLVVEGRKTWEAALMLQDDKVNRVAIPSLDSQPPLDGNDFPKIDLDQFQNRGNDASLGDCILAATFSSIRSTQARTPERSEIPSSHGGAKESISTTLKASNKHKAIASANRPPKSTAVMKGRGRPRKYQTTGVPADIDSWGVDDIKALIESRRMYENYQKLKITDEIERRLLNREEPVFVTHQILETTDAHRKEQGEQPMSKFLVMQILHEYAGGDEPLQEDDTVAILKNMLKEAHHPKFPRGKWPRTRRPPSVPAKTVHGGDVHLSTNSRSSGLESIGIRARRPPKAFDQSPILQDAITKKPRGKNSQKSQKMQKDATYYWHFPSVAAHSKPHYHTPLVNIKLQSPMTKTLYWHLPSVAANSRPHHAISHAAVAANQTVQWTTTKKSRRSRKTIDVDVESGIEGSPSKRQKLATSSIHNAVALTDPLLLTSPAGTATEETLQPNVSVNKPSPWAMQNIMSEKYDKAAASVFRPSHGLYVSKTAQRYKRRDDPVSMKTKTYQLAIFKFPSLLDLDWFIQDHPVSHLDGSFNQRHERSTRTLDTLDDVVLSLPASGILPGLGEHSASAKGEANTSSPIQERATNRQRQATANGLVTPQNEIDDNVERTVTASTPPTSPLSEHGRQIRSSEAPKSVKQPFSITSRPLLSTLNALRSPPREGALVCKSPLPQLYRGASGLDQTPHPQRGAELLGQAIPTSVACLEGGTRSASLVPHNGAYATDPSLQNHPPERATNDFLSATLEQDPADFIFKFPGLKNLDWFQDRTQNYGQDAILTPRLESGQTSVLGASPSNLSYYEAPTLEEHLLAVVNNLPISRKDRGLGKPVRFGGSTTILRRDIVLHLVRKCGGVFPEASAMKIPFGNEWSARGQSGIPEKNTVVNAVNVCCEQGKLRRIVFSFKDRLGITATSTVFALPEIDSGDPKVREVQEMITKRHPQIFVPNAVMPKDAVTVESMKMKRHRMLEEAAEKRERINEAKGMALKSQEEREAYLAALHKSDRSEQEKRALSRFAEPSTRKLPRLGTIGKQAKTPLSLPVSTQEHTGGALPSSLLSKPSQHIEIRRPRRSRSSHLDPSYPLRPTKDRTNEFSFRSQQSRWKIRELANNASQNERSQKRADRESLDTEYGGFHQSLGVSEEHNVYGFMDPVIEKHNETGTFSTGFCGSRNIDSLSKPSPGNRKRKRVENDQYIFPGFMDPTVLYHDATGTFYSNFSGVRVGTTKVNSRGLKKNNMRAMMPFGNDSTSPLPTAINKAPVPLLEIEDQSPRFPGVMGPDVLHPSSGTFSGRFLGLKIDRPWASGANPLRRRTRLYSKHSKTNSDLSTDVQGFAVVENPSGRNRKKRRVDSMILNESAKPSLDIVAERPLKLRRMRGPQKSKSMGENGALRLFVAVMVIRILTGGLRMTIDWTLVANVFAPVYDETFIRARWGAVLAKMKNNQLKMYAGFQALFARAYEEGIVPKLDFERLEAYDWKWLVEWTIANLDTPANSAPELLADRQAFDKRFSLKEGSQEKDLAHFYELEGFSIQALRTSVINRQAHVCHLFRSSSLSGSSENSLEDEHIAVARSRIRANILTPAERYDSRTARADLETFPEPIIEASLKGLLQGKVVIERYKARKAPGRDYEICDYFEKRLRTNISPAQFHCAVAFKLRLDQAFDVDGKARWSYFASDGDAMALLNLLANRRIRLVPVNPPLNKWGHTDDGYATRQMDKSRLNFEMDILPTPNYVSGIPLESLPTPPAPHLIETSGQPRKIPVWYDINDDLITKMWKPVVAAVLGLLAVRTGASAAELQVNISPSLEIWEVEEVLAWMVKARVADRVGREGYLVKEWWWTALGNPAEADLVDHGYKLGFATMADKPNNPKRRQNKTEEWREKTREGVSGVATRTRNVVGTARDQEEDAMDVD